MLASLGMSFSDWYSMGVVFHKHYLAHPEVRRRPQGGRGEQLAIAWSTLLGAFIAAVYLALASMMNVAGTPRVFTLSNGIWLLAPLPFLVSQ